MTDTTNRPLTDVSDMVVVHRAFRREFRLLPLLVRAVPAGDTARAAVVAGHARLVLLGLHLHHTGEDELLWPKLLDRCTFDAALVHRMEGQHERVEHSIARLGPALDRWEAEARPAVTEEVASTFDELADALLEHLDEEEREILPLAATHIAPEEWAQLGEHGMSRIGKSQLPILFGSVLEEATPAERTMMLRVVPPPVRLLVRTVFAWQYRRYVTRVRAAG
ncbi:hemerythrin domain-containing protein [Modestobacter sp. URMC 112]